MPVSGFAAIAAVTWAEAGAAGPRSTRIGLGSSREVARASAHGNVEAQGDDERGHAPRSWT
jgi:hypothetical protein